MLSKCEVLADTYLAYDSRNGPVLSAPNIGEDSFGNLLRAQTPYIGGNGIVEVEASSGHHVYTGASANLLQSFQVTT